MPNSIPEFAPIPTVGSSKSQQAHTPSGEAASLSLDRNSIGATIDGPENRELPAWKDACRLTGSQKKTAFALELNIATICREAGVERVGFLTLTVGDQEAEKFVQVWDVDEASRRINSLLTNLLKDLFERMVIVSERHQSGAIHFHLCVETKEDIRGAFDFSAFLRARNARKAGTVDAEAEKTYQDSAPEHLRRLWAILRDRLPGFGFGRAELTPIYKGGEAISRYVAKYVEKNLSNRKGKSWDDSGRRLVRYSGWNKTHTRAHDFSWATPKACEWRRKVRAIAASASIKTKEQMAATIGPRWAWRATGAMFDLQLGGWAKLNEPVWHEGMMTRDEQELARDFIGRDAESFRRMAGRGSRIEDREKAFERQMTEAEMERLRYDLEDLSHWREAEGLGDVDYAWTKGGRA